MIDRTAGNSALLQKGSLRHLLILLGVVGGAVGWWLPWVIHESGTAALVLLGLDLGDYPKYMEVWKAAGHGGRELLQAERLFFFLPPVLASAILVLEASSRRDRRYLLLLPLALFLSLVILPAIDLLFDQAGDLKAEYAFQLYAAITGVAVSGLWGLWPRVPPVMRDGLMLLLALAGAFLPAWALWRYWLVLDGLYGGGAVVGVGIILSSGSFTLILLLVLARVLTRRTQPERPVTTQKPGTVEAPGVGEKSKTVS